MNKNMFKHIPENAYPYFGGGGDDLSGLEAKVDKILGEIDKIKSGKVSGSVEECKDCKEKDKKIKKLLELLKESTGKLKL